MSLLLGYAHGTGIYARQRGPNPIPTVKIGPYQRVCAEDAIKELQNVRERDKKAAETFLRIYYSFLKDEEQTTNE